VLNLLLYNLLLFFFYDVCLSHINKVYLLTDIKPSTHLSAVLPAGPGNIHLAIQGRNDWIFFTKTLVIRLLITEGRQAGMIMI